jgi:hypothetical protein
MVQPSSNALSASATIEAMAVRALSALHGSSVSASCASGVNSIGKPERASPARCSG